MTAIIEARSRALEHCLVPAPRSRRRLLSGMALCREPPCISFYALRQRFWLGCAVLLAIAGFLISIVWLAGNFSSGEAGCYWDASSADWVNCSAPDMRWRIWPLAGLAHLGAGVSVLPARFLENALW